MVRVVQLFGSRMAVQAAGFLTVVVAARGLDPAAFGRYALAIVLAALIAQIPGSGLDLAAVRVSARSWERAPDRARGVLLTAGVCKLSVNLCLVLLMVGLADPLAEMGAIRPDVVMPIRYAALSAFALALTDLALSTLQAQERFGPILGINLLTAALRFLPVGALFVMGLLSLERALLAYLAGAYLGALASVVVAWRCWGGPARWGQGIAHELWNFSAWFLLATLIGTVTSGLDTLVLAQLVGPAAVGLYSSGRTLALPLAMLGAAVGAVLLPRLGRLAEREAIGAYARRFGLRLGAAVAALCALLVMGAPELLPLVFGPRYAPAVPIFQILVLAYGVQAVIWPVLTMLMVLDRTRAIAGLNLIMLLAVSLGYAVTVPTCGAVGAALTLLGTYLLVLFLSLLVARHALQADRGSVDV